MKMLKLSLNPQFCDCRRLVGGRLKANMISEVLLTARWTTFFSDNQLNSLPFTFWKSPGKTAAFWFWPTVRPDLGTGFSTSPDAWTQRQPQGQQQWHFIPQNIYKCDIGRNVYITKYDKSCIIYSTCFLLVYCISKRCTVNLCVFLSCLTLLSTWDGSSTGWSPNFLPRKPCSSSIFTC